MEKIYQKHDTQHVAATVVYADRSGMLFADSDYTVSFVPYAERKMPYELLIDAYMNGTLLIMYQDGDTTYAIRPSSMSGLGSDLNFNAVTNAAGGLMKQFVLIGK